MPFSVRAILKRHTAESHWQKIKPWLPYINLGISKYQKRKRNMSVISATLECTQG